MGKTQVYEWLARYREQRPDGLVPRSRRRARKIAAMLAREGWPVPAVSTVHQVLVRRGLVDHVPSRREPPGGWRRFWRCGWPITGTW